jgi:cation transport ATPase
VRIRLQTGTLTSGVPTVVAVRPLPAGPCREEDLLALAAAAEAGSEHPVGRAIVAAARDRGIELLPATGFRAEVGRTSSTYQLRNDLGLLAALEARKCPRCPAGS